jgi:nuclear pore complex protein Nup85
VHDKDYGLAVSYCTSAEDWSGVGRIVDQVLKEYVTGGELPRYGDGYHGFIVALGSERFAKYASTIAPTAQQLRTQNVQQGIFAHRLLFTVRYAQYHELRSQGNLADAAQELISIFYDDLAPKSWWAVLLSDAVELLQNGT